MLADLRFAFRQLIKAPGFTTVAVLTLALGIGACTAMFGVVNAVLLKPLPFRDPDRLVWIENIGRDGLSARTSRADVFTEWREKNQSFDALAAYFAFSAYAPKIMTSAGGGSEPLADVGVSDNFLPTLGIELLHGRNFTAEESAWNGPGAAILSHAFWQRSFGGDPGVVGDTVTINNQAVTIVGILPRTFDFDAVFTPGSEVDLLTPFPLAPETARWGNTVFGIGRLHPGVSLDQAQAELDVINQRLREANPQRGNFGARLSSLDGSVRGDFRGAFLILAAAVACVLAIACVNLSNLLLARINIRRQEFAIRIALGARRRHLIRQTLTESLLLAGAGSLVGIPVAIWATRAVASLQTFGVPLLQDASVDLVALGVTIGLTALAGVGCGLLPALHLSGQRQRLGLQNASQQRSAGRSSAVVRNGLVVAEVALSCMLLVGAGLLLRSFNAVLSVNLGFQPQQAMAWHLSTPRNFDSLAEATNHFDGAIARVAAIPSVTAVGLSDTLPLGRNRTWGAGAKGVEYPPGEYPFAFPRVVDSNYLSAMAIPLRAGRYFDERDRADATNAIIINENLAHQLWPDQDAIGRVINVNGESTVIGVVGNVRHSSLEDSGGNEMYLNYHQSDDWGALDMVVRSTQPPAALIAAVRTELSAYDPTLTSGEYFELEQLIDNAVAPRRLITRLLGGFSTLALTLAALGLYGVIAYSVVQRTQEIGIRMAIGAQRRDVVQLILQGGLKLVALGIALGLGGALVLTRVLQSQLYGVTAHDPLTFVGNALLLVAVATVACLLPALRATRIDPITALRAD